MVGGAASIGCHRSLTLGLAYFMVLSHYQFTFAGCPACKKREEAYKKKEKKKKKTYPEGILLLLHVEAAESVVALFLYE